MQHSAATIPKELGGPQFGSMPAKKDWCTTWRRVGDYLSQELSVQNLSVQSLHSTHTASSVQFKLQLACLTCFLNMDIRDNRDKSITKRWIMINGKQDHTVLFLCEVQMSPKLNRQ